MGISTILGIGNGRIFGRTRVWIKVGYLVISSEP